MMTNILADLAIDSEASTLMAFRVARAVDAMESNEQERHLARVATPLAKFWNCKRAPAFVAEALECHGGNGFIEENPMARLYREAPLNAIWEGTSNMMCMDVLRSMRRDRATSDAFMAEVIAPRAPTGTSIAGSTNWAPRSPDPAMTTATPAACATAWPTRCRRASCIENASPDVFETFCRSRLQGDWGYVFGTLDSSPELKGIVERATRIAALAEAGVL